MKAEELRIGNYFLLGDKVRKVESIEPYSGVNKWQDMGASSVIRFNEMKPIPLTEEWLLKFGFEKRDQGVCDYFHTGMNPVTHDFLFDLVWIKKSIGGYEKYPFYKNGHFEIKYVHKLQNLYYALTGEELTLKPQK